MLTECTIKCAIFKCNFGERFIFRQENLQRTSLKRVHHDGMLHISPAVRFSWEIREDILGKFCNFSFRSSTKNSSITNSWHFSVWKKRVCFLKSFRTIASYISISPYLFVTPISPPLKSHKSLNFLKCYLLGQKGEKMNRRLVFEAQRSTKSWNGTKSYQSCFFSSFNWFFPLCSHLRKFPCNYTLKV